MRKVIALCVLASSLVVPPVWARVTYSKVDDTTMKITSEQMANVTVTDLKNRKTQLEKALAEVDDLLSEAAKLGVTKEAINEV